MRFPELELYELDPSTETWARVAINPRFVVSVHPVHDDAKGVRSVLTVSTGQQYRLRERAFVVVSELAYWKGWQLPDT